MVNENIEHNFDLADMCIGDWFLGCRECSFQIPKSAAAKTECPECGKKMKLYTVTSGDVVTKSFINEDGSLYCK
jgi:rRNA maturation endonuclease Nob1